ncbi:MAG TPA: nucleotidyltransferase family protein [Pyrinomonadaceae bacterium]|nr:nucleotidyltransferase family protein [Pyrinomonadaceae bacterium]
MTTAPRHETSHPAFALRLLLGGAAPAGALGAGGWEELLRVARRNFVLVRLSDRLGELGINPPAFFEEEAGRERQRAAAMLDIIGRVTRACEGRGVAHVFAKSFQHHPDMGGDIDLFVESRSAEVDKAVLEGTAAEPVPRDLRARVSGVTCYRVCGGEFVLEIHHGRVGLLGEHGALVGQLIRNARRGRVGGGEFLLPSAEDLLVLHGAQRVYRSGPVRLCDVLSTAALVRPERLDWDYLLRTSERLGTAYGLRSYLTYAGQIYREASGRELLPAGPRAELEASGCGRAEPRGGVYVFPRGRVVARVYLGKVRAAVRAGNWEALGRLSLTPLLAASALARALKPRARAGRGRGLVRAEGGAGVTP